jgi:hypothetical protein
VRYAYRIEKGKNGIVESRIGCKISTQSITNRSRRENVTNLYECRQSGLYCRIEVVNRESNREKKRGRGSGCMVIGWKKFGR